MTTRRSFIGSVGLVALAGCNGSQPGGDGGAGSGEIDGGDGGMQLLDSFNRIFTIQEDGWQGREFSFEDTGEIRYDAVVRSGPPVDFIVMDQSELQSYRNGDRFRYYSSASDMDTTSANVSAGVAPGEYAFVIDNTNAGEARPPTNLDDDTVRVEVTLELYS